MGVCASKSTTRNDQYHTSTDYYNQPSQRGASTRPANDAAAGSSLAASRAQARASAPARPRTPEPTVKFLRNDSEGCLIEITVVNPIDEDRDFAAKQKADLLNRLGADGVARLQPQGFETTEKFTLFL